MPRKKYHVFGNVYRYDGTFYKHLYKSCWTIEGALKVQDRLHQGTNEHSWIEAW